MAAFAPASSTHAPREIIEGAEGSASVRDGTEGRRTGALGTLALSGIAEHDGTSVVVGREGSAWLRRDERWHSLDTPLETDLNAATLDAAGTLLIAGKNGSAALLHGLDSDDWHVLDTGVGADLTGAAWLADGSALLVGADET